ncbi:MAG: F0F1 ATP synthase subunit B [Rhodothermales bacterium]|jgi:F-type H+-transporting ATPase subunit b|nr:F0F1 ATP synthase subunit B [Rhodothermales bacterium]MDG2016101.1 F0F1 ATP synthase subunit B [Rhodothermales bacterium]
MFIASSLEIGLNSLAASFGGGWLKPYPYTMIVLAANLLAPDAGLIVWITITFAVLLFLLKKFAWGPITSALATREDTIRESMEQAERALAEAKQLQSDNTKARREAEAQAQSIIREARDESERLRTEEVDKTRDQIHQLQETAKAEIEREKENALNSLRQEVADLAIQAAEAILRENLDADRQKKIVEDFLGDLSKN